MMPIQNTQIILDENSHGTERVWPILDFPVFCLWIATHHEVFFKLSLFKNCIKTFFLS